MASFVVMTVAGVNVVCAASSAPVQITPPELSTSEYESSPTFTPDGQQVFFMLATREFRRYQLRWSVCENGQWSAPRPPLFAADPGVLEADPFITADGGRLYFVSARQGDKPDDLDIWYVEREPDGHYRKAHRLPEPINSLDVELLPRATSDGRLYFGSDRPGGHGQMDIYIGTPDKKGKWLVANMGPPISTKANEYELEVSRDERTAIVVADRGDRSHLYHYEKRGSDWYEIGRIPARDDVFQVGPLLSPRADRLLFAQAGGADSGEWFVVDLRPNADKSWPPQCAPKSSSR